MVDILIFNKDPNSLSTLKKKINSNIFEQDYTIVGFQFEMDLMDYIYSASPEKFIVFYDESNPEKGLEISKKIYDISNKGRFCLMSEQVPENVEDLFYCGVAYFISPEDEMGLSRCLKRFFEFYDESFHRVLTIRKQSGTQAIPLYKIDYIMSDKRKVIVNEKDNSHEFYCKLDELEEVTKGLFVRCHQSYLVNMKKIKSFAEDGLYLNSGQFIPVSRKKYYATKRTYLQFVTGKSDIIQM